MEAIRQDEKCETCHWFEYDKIEMALDEVSTAAAIGCVRCKLISESARLFRDEWAYLKEEDANESVRVSVSEWLACENGPVVIALEWPIEIASFRYLPLQITTEEHLPMLDRSFGVARAIPSSPTAPERLEFVRSRLASCTRTHGDCKLIHGKVMTMPERLLRISDCNGSRRVVLVETQGMVYKYVALSHCWGSSKETVQRIPKTTTHSLETHETTGLLWDSLTRTFRDAIDMSYRLGVEYIWIDSLCIVQDDIDHKARELPKMGEKYGKAYLVIAASLAENGDYGLYRERPANNFTFKTATGEVVRAAAGVAYDHSLWRHMQGYWSASDLPLLGRAWAFQERLLACRVVHFTPTELVWECRTSIDCECGELVDQSRNFHPELTTGTNFKTAYAKTVRRGNGEDQTKFWNVICEQYSARDITFPTDRLPALSSIARQVNSLELLGRYLAGIWESTLPQGLL